MRRQLRRLRDTARVLPWLLLSRLAPIPREDPPDDLSDKRLLVVQWNAIGDALMTTPLLWSLKKRFPRTRIDILATHANHPVFDARTDVGSVESFHCGPISKWRLWRDLRRRRYDLIIDVSGVVRSACITRSLNGRSSIGFSRSLEAGFFKIELATSYHISRPYSEKNYIPTLIESLADTWCPSISGQMTFDVPARATERAKDWYETNRIEAARSLILHPGAKWRPKRWPESHWIDLSRRLTDRWTPILVGSRDDETLIRRISAAVGPGSRELIGCDIPTLAAVVREARGAVCNDSFIMHLAAAVGRPVVALFGPVDPGRVAPKASSVEVLYRGEFCSPCDLYFSAARCWRGLNFCLHHIAPDEALQALERLIEDR